MSEFDAILFHIRDMKDGNNPLERKENQHYVMVLAESPLNDNFQYTKFESYFNWTMTYRQDSDFPRPYGWVVPIDWKEFYPTSSYKNDWSKYVLSNNSVFCKI